MIGARGVKKSWCNEIHIKRNINNLALKCLHETIGGNVVYSRQYISIHKTVNLE